MTPSEAVVILDMALSEVGWPGEAHIVLKPDGSPGAGFSRDVPPDTAFMAFTILYKARGLPFPETFDEWWDAPEAWWNVAFEPETAGRAVEER